MPSRLDLRRRIRSVKATEQITKAMKMVAAARLRRWQARILEARPYAEELALVLRRVAAKVPERRHPLLQVRPEERVALVVVTGDKGLCGAFNANVLREVSTILEQRRFPEVELTLVGRKGLEYFRHKGIPLASQHLELMGRLTPEGAYALSRELRETFESGRVDAVYVVYTHFKSLLQQRVQVEKLLPIEREQLGGENGEASVLFEPTPQAILHALLPRHVDFQVWRILLDSVTAEHAARMVAMDAASKNASEMIDRLTLTYNRVRQATITKELIEIVSGAAALGGR
ncbi:MAG: ATP synthase F1 subunit gamma [Thermoanaerobaculum sp.]|nr:ATP synthase F1 subunit gamma [Thermoanaerobaculum sp.]MDW7967928.1 ATP synthase F1 subunit gamma [Thermoanaerobaculum sp.]